MKRLFFCLSVLGMMLTGCSKNDDGKSDKPNNNGNEQPENPNEPKLPELPALPDPDDVCSAMDDLNFMAYCYGNFDVNKDGKVSVTEANAVNKIKISYSRYFVSSLKGIERFPNLRKVYLHKNGIHAIDLSYNLKITSLDYSEYDSDFSECTGLKTVIFPKTLKSIGSKVFSGCYRLAEIELPASLISIEADAFQNCTNLMKITCHALTPPTTSGYLLGINNYGKPYISENLYVPAESIQAYKDSPWANNFKNILPIE